MQESYIQELFAQRIGGNKFGKSTEVYIFERINRARKEAEKKNPNVEVIDMGVGEPDEMADMRIVEKLYEQAKKPENRVYPDNGIFEFHDAAAKYLEKVYGVSGVNPHTEVMHSIGAKEALVLLTAAFINPGDITLMPSPSYGVLGIHTKYYGGEIVELPLKKENNFLPDFDSLSDDVKKRVKLMYLNYPNNPTGACATEEFFEKVVKFAKENNIIVVHDAAYGALTFDEQKPLSFLSVKGAKDVGIEVHSMSKGYNMTGWRIGFAVGNELIMNAFSHVKLKTDCGQFIPIQLAAKFGLEHPEISEKIAEKYSRRHDLLTNALKELGFNVNKSKGSYFMYVEIPKGLKNGRKFETAAEFSEFLIYEKLISTVPWDDAGHFIRLSVTFNAKDEQEEKRIINEFRSRLADLEFEF